MTALPEVKELDSAKVTEVTPSKQPKNEEKTPSEQPKLVEETQDQINWRKFRQERERERKEKLDADKRLVEKQRETEALKAALESIVNKPQSIPNNQDESEETEDQRIEKKVSKAFEEREKQYVLERQKRDASELPQKLKSAFSDFDQVTSQENIDYLQFHYPEVYAPYKDAPATFDTYANFYKAIKKFVPSTDSRKDQAKIEKNLSKPQSMSSPGMSATGDHAPMELSEQRRKDNWVRMQRIMKGVK